MNSSILVEFVFMTDEDRDRFPFNDLGEVLHLQIAASRIPDGSTVRKPTGGSAYTLRRQLRVYVEQPTKKEREAGEPTLAPMTIDGCFLVGSRGDITKIKDDKVLCWMVEAESLLIFLSESFDPDIRCPQ